MRQLKIRPIFVSNLLGAILIFSASQAVSPDQNAPYAKSVVNAVILDGNVGNDYKNTDWILGAPDDEEVSLGGPGASILVDMGADTPIVNGVGPDLEVREIGAAFGGVDESYRVLVSNSTDTNSFLEVGIGRAISLFDIHATGLSSARYVQIVDLATETLNSQSPGSDIDAITSMHNEQLPSGRVQVQGRFTGQGAWISWQAPTNANLQGYALRRSLDGIAFSSTPDFTFPTNETAYHDLSLPVVGDLYYALSALTDAGESALTVVHLPSYTLALHTNGPVHLGDDQVPAWEVLNPQPLLVLAAFSPAKNILSCFDPSQSSKVQMRRCCRAIN